MTPKQKAKELVDKFTRSQYYGCLGCGEDYDDKQESAKQCALIAVDEILDEIQPFELAWEYQSKIEFWNNVKKEIEAL